jgi:small subunit ribosomal protein S7
MVKKLGRHKVLPDTLYSSTLLARFINLVMQKGKKSLAERVVYKALDTVKEKLNKNALEVFQEAITNVKPVVEIKSRRIGGATYQIPISVEDRRSEGMAFRWIIDTAKKKKGRSMDQKLANEIIDAHNKTGTAMERREATHRMAEANKAFAHFA